MNARKTLARIIEFVFPEQVAKLRETNRARRTAMQLMLDANRELRTKGYKAEYINGELRNVMNYYKHGRYQKCIICFPAK